MKELIEVIVKALVDNPDQAMVRAVEREQVTIFECTDDTTPGFSAALERLRK